MSLGAGLCLRTLSASSGQVSVILPSEENLPGR